MNWPKKFFFGEAMSENYMGSVKAKQLKNSMVSDMVFILRILYFFSVYLF
jgi:hypothetical protein